jgi:iron-sulfur cluster repair protein YtfE (RIC family)
MATELAAHWQGEETGLFRVMAREEMFAEHITPLIREHRELAELLATVDILEPEGQQAIRTAVFDSTSTSARKRTGSFPPR